MKETETLSYTLLCQLYEEVQGLEEDAMKDFFKSYGKDFEISAATLRRTSTIKYMIEDKLFILWKEENNK